LSEVNLKRTFYTITNQGFSIMKIIYFLLLLPVFLFAHNGYLSPEDLKLSPDGKYVYVIEKTANQMVKLNAENQKIEKVYSMPDMPMDMTISANGQKMYVTCGEGEGYWVEVDLKSGKMNVTKAGHSPMAPCLSLDQKKIYISNRLEDTLSEWDIATKKRLRTVKVSREAVATVLSKDGQFLFVANHLPTGRANVDRMTSVIEVVNTKTFKVVKKISLPNGAIDLRRMAISHDGKWILVPSVFARFLVPTNQIERGWINTHAMNIIDVKKQELFHTVLLDDPDLGAANAWGVAFSQDDKLIAVAHSATHEVSVIDAAALFKKLETAPTRQPGETLEVFETNVRNPANQLNFISSVRQRIKLEGLGPKGIAFNAKGELYVAQFFSDNIGYIDLSDVEYPYVENLSLGPVKKMDQVREGEFYFNDASICFQQWQTCSTCHPDVRTDAVNWDLLNDGIGNPKSTKSLLLSHVTPRAMVTGIRESAEVAVRAGIRFIQFTAVDEERAKAIDAFLRQLKPIPSPYLVDGKLSESAIRGKKVFRKANCVFCHSGEYYTDMKLHNVGTGMGLEKNTKFDTPTLVETYRTRPYLHQGQAKDLREMLTIYNKDDKHGKTSQLTEKEIDDLIEYIMSL